MNGPVYARKYGKYESQYFPAFRPNTAEMVSYTRDLSRNTGNAITVFNANIDIVFGLYNLNLYNFVLFLAEVHTVFFTYIGVNTE